LNKIIFQDKRDRFIGGPDRYKEITSNRYILGHITDILNKSGCQELKYLDIGCSEGIGSVYLKNILEKILSKKIELYGTDISLKCRDSCIKNDIKFMKLDLNEDTLPFKDHFDIITVFEVIEHIFYTDFFIQSVYSALKPGGIAIITTLNTVSWKNRILVPLGIQPMNTEVSAENLGYGYRYEIIKNYMKKWKPAGHIRQFTLYSLEDFLKDNKFKVSLRFGIENWRYFRFLESLPNMCTSIGMVITK